MNVMRTISALLLKRLLKPIVIIIAIIALVLYTITALLAFTFSSWWLLSLLILVPVTLFIVLLISFIWFLLGKLSPRQLTNPEQDKLQNFIDTILSLAERSKTPYPILIFIIAKDVVRGKDSSFLRDLIGDSKKVTKEFEEIRTLFR